MYIGVCIYKYTYTHTKDILLLVLACSLDVWNYVGINLFICIYIYTCIHTLRIYMCVCIQMYIVYI